MSRSRLLASLVAALLLGVLVASGAIGFSFRSLTFPAMVIVGWACVFFGDGMADVLGLRPSYTASVVKMQRLLIQGLGWLALVIGAGLILIPYLYR